MSTRSGVLQCAFGMTVLGASVPVSRLVLDFPDLTGQAGRYAVAALVFVAIIRLRRLPRVPLSWGDGVRLVALAATGLVAFNVLLLTALRHADPAVVGTVVGGTPLVLALLGPLQRRQRPGGALLLAALVVIAGGALVHGGGSADPIGLAAALGTLAGEVLFSLLAVPLLPRLGPLRVSTYSCVLAVPMLGVALVLAGEPARWRVPTVAETAGYLYLGALLTVIAFLAWYGGLGKLGAERAGLFVGLLPPVSLAVTALIDLQRPATIQIVGVLVVGAGLVLGLRGGAPGRAPGRAPDRALGGADAVHVGEDGGAQGGLRVEPGGDRVGDLTQERRAEPAGAVARVAVDG
jgi:drug/metabolite transporter (DMT)-like permease